MPDDPGSIWYLILVLALIGVNALFAMSEIAIITLNDAKLHHDAENGNKKAKKLCKLVSEPNNFLATIQVAITLAGLLSSAFAADKYANFFTHLITNNVSFAINEGIVHTVVLVLLTVVLSYVTLVFGELVPKRIAMKKSESLALGISGLISGISVLFKPIVWILSVSTNLILRVIGIDPNEEDEQVSEEEILMLVETGGEKGAIDKDEQDFIRNVFEFDDLCAGDIVTHRTDVTLLWTEDDDRTWDDTVRNSRYTRYPVCDESPDNVVAILNAEKYFRLDDHSRATVMAHAVETPYFVPETIKADVLFGNMKKTKNSLAVVIDEHGGMVGIVTFSDLIEELVGELREDDPSDGTDVTRIERISENKWRIIGNVELSDLEEALETDLDTDGVNTFTGLVFKQLDVALKDGEQDLCVETPGFSILIKNIKDHQVVLAEITKINDDTAAPAIEDKKTEKKNGKILQ